MKYKYFRLCLKEHFVGFRRISKKGEVEYLPAGSDEWQKNSIEHSPDEVVCLTTLPMGIESLKGAKE